MNPSTQSPPSSITGGKLPSGELGLDWLQGSFDTTRVQMYQVRDLITKLGEAFSPHVKGFNGYVYSELTPNGCFIAYTPDRLDAMFSIPGDVVEQLDGIAQMELLQNLLSLGVKLTRIDIRFDDYARTIDPMAVHTQRRSVGNFKRCYPHFPDNPQTGELLGAGVEFGRTGKNGGGRRWMIYDKLLESPAEGRDCVRWELRLCDERARVNAAYLADCADAATFTRRLGEVLGGNIDFRDRSSGDHHWDRLPRLGWWQTILDRIGEATLLVRRSKPKLRETIEYLFDAYGSTFACIKIAFEQLGGGSIADFFDELASAGEARLGRSHLARIEQYVKDERRRESESLCLNVFSA